ncbi:hypothetical protein P154DRAFT_524743 [Amniculicola lignicola CBS 123094]|uniref:SAP domain-containing protein n=1 Tax=Amniculicola lignicola CBS 123094 TaxID=1392246 RepID=A0A6A5W839_9PLEO|nr:hypothetical protein P154DRAFT_524743 [Amniculicola lignicola CBS 123094]
MHASRASSRALKHLAASRSTQSRSLSMTGPATFSSLLTSERPAGNLPQHIAGLRAECQKRKLPTAGSKAELIDRLSAHEVSSTRTFSTAIDSSKRPVPNTSDTTSTPIRHFNTSRSLKSVNDSSTIDFAYLPDYDPDSGETPVLRVPILPQTQLSEATKSATAADLDEGIDVMLPTIMTVAADGTHIYAPSAMSEVSDNNSIDFQGMAAKVASKLSAPINADGSMTKQILNSLVDDVFGPKGKRA